MSKTLAIILLIFIIWVAVFKFSLIIDNSQNYCPLGPLARDCRANANLGDHVVALKDLSRALPWGDTIIQIIAALLAIGLFALVRKFRESVRLMVFKQRAFLAVMFGQRPVLCWIELHEGGAPAVRQ